MTIENLINEQAAGTGFSEAHGAIEGGHLAKINEIIDTINGLDTPSEFPYTPTTEADWPDPDPTTLQEGLDQLAARLETTTTALEAIDTAAEYPFVEGTPGDWAVPNTNLQQAIDRIAAQVAILLGVPIP